MKVLISGYYGYGNYGDNSMLMSVIGDIKAVCENADITVISGTPAETKKSFAVKALHKYDIFSLLLSIVSCDLLILGSGTLIQDITSTRSLLYYLWIIRLAKLFKKKVMIYANGFRSLTSFKNGESTRDTLNLVDVITLRDSESLKELENIGVSGPEIRVTADPEFLLIPDDDGIEILSHYGIPENKSLLGIAIHKSAKLPWDFEETMAAICDYAVEKYDLFPIFLPMEKRMDYSLCASIKNKMRNRSVIVGTNYKIPLILSIFKQMHLCIGTNIHSLIYSLISNVPMVGISDTKDAALWKYMNDAEYFVGMEELSKESVKTYIDNILSNYEMTRSTLKFNVRILRGKARENRELMKELIYGKKN